MCDSVSSDMWKETATTIFVMHGPWGFPNNYSDTRITQLSTLAVYPALAFHKPANHFLN